MEITKLAALNFTLYALNEPDPDNAGVGNGLWSLTNVGSTPTSDRFN